MTSRATAHRPLAGLVLATLIGLAYSPALWGGFLWDDDAHVTANATLRSLDGLRRIWLEPGAIPQYYPLTHTLFWCEFQLWGLHPFGYHVVNVVLHIANAVLLWFLLRRLRIPGAWFATAIFALHPVQVESVAWITELKNLLSGFFYFLALHAYLNARPLDATTDAKLDGRWYGAALVLFASALFAKTVVCSLPATMLLLMWWKRGRVTVRAAAGFAPFFIVGMALASVTIWMEKGHVGASGPEFALSFVDRCLIAGRALWFYVGRIYWPRHLSFIYPRWEINARAWWAYLPPIGALVAAVALFMARRRLGRGGLAAALFFTATLLPALGFFNVYWMRFSFVADHFLYLASIGVITATVAVATCSARTRRAVPALQVTAWALIIALGTLTWQQTHFYESPATLWSHTLRENPQCWLAHNELGTLLLADGRTADARREFQLALEIQPEPLIQENLGVALAAEGRIDEGAARIAHVLQDDPKNARAQYKLGSIWAEAGRWEDAERAYRAALALQPDMVEAHTDLGNALLVLRHDDDAFSELEEAVRLGPYWADAHALFGLALYRRGQLDDAVTQYQLALALNPHAPEVHDHLGVALTMQGHFDAAQDAFATAVRYKPDFAEAYVHWGAALGMQGRVDEAIERFHEALRYDPQSEDAQRNLRIAEAARAAGK